MKNALKLLKKSAIYIAFFQAWAAMLGSLYFSEIQNLAPCQLCWYQRIFMYPLVFIFTVALIKKDKNVGFYALPLSITGLAIATYQYLLQITPLKESTPLQCDLSGASCASIQFNLFNFITIPFLSILAFLTISILMFIMIKSKAK